MVSESSRTNRSETFRFVLFDTSCASQYILSQMSLLCLEQSRAGSKAISTLLPSPSMLISQQHQPSKTRPHAQCRQKTSTTSSLSLPQDAEITCASSALVHQLGSSSPSTTATMKNPTMPSVAAKTATTSVCQMNSLRRRSSKAL